MPGVGDRGPRASGRRLAPVVAAILLASACAPKVRLTLPAGDGSPIADVTTVESIARGACRTPDALTADLRLSGRIDGDRVRGTLQVGASRETMRIEGLAPFGAPVFVLAARPDGAILVLPRETAVARAASAADLLEAVVGVGLTPADLLAIVAGCGVADWEVRGGATFGDQWVRVDLDEGRRLWLRRLAPGAAPLVVAAEDARWRVEYTRVDGTWPTAIRLVQRAPGPVRTDAVLAVDAPEALDALPPGALEVIVPRDAREVSLADLRRNRELAER